MLHHVWGANERLPTPEGLRVARRHSGALLSAPEGLGQGVSADRVDLPMIKRNGDKTHCPQGHEYDEANTYRWNGRRFCRTCMNVRTKEWQKRNRRKK